jgi:hypothetical protein
MHEYVEHIERLAEEHHADIYYVIGPFPHQRPVFRPQESYADPYNRYVVLSNWDEGAADIQYVVALHELGHVVHRHHEDAAKWGGFWRTPPEELIALEAEANDWAITNAEHALTKRGRDMLSLGLASYMRDATGYPTPLPENTTTLSRVMERLGTFDREAMRRWSATPSLLDHTHAAWTGAMEKLGIDPDKLTT